MGEEVRQVAILVKTCARCRRGKEGECWCKSLSSISRRRAAHSSTCWRASRFRKMLLTTSPVWDLIRRLLLSSMTLSQGEGSGLVGIYRSTVANDEVVINWS